MVEVLQGPNFNIGNMPMEIDVYKDPHNRMKELVGDVVENIQLELLNLDKEERERILQRVYLIMWELKTHEIIENLYIMNKLKERLNALEVYNQLVCNCHEDSSLLHIIELVEIIHGSPDIISTNYHWQRLQTAVYEFMDEFVPHMEEEEKTFQPLLCKYFEYEELKKLKETVVEQHQVWKKKVEDEKNLAYFKDELAQEYQAVQRSSSYCDKLRRLSSESKPEVESLPEEIILEIFKYLNPVDLCRAGAVCRQWRQLSLNQKFWRVLPLHAWSSGNMAWINSEIDTSSVQFTRDREVEEDRCNFFTLISRFLLLVGENVRLLNVSGCFSIQDGHLYEFLQRCPNLVHLDISYAPINEYGLKNLGDLKLKHFNASGCTGVSNRTLQRLAEGSAGSLEYLNLSGCFHITDRGLLSLYNCNQYLKFIDLSGCYRLTGGVLTAFISACPSLSAENLSYCSMIQDGPHPEDSNGCQNYECDLRACCSNFM